MTPSPLRGIELVALDLDGTLLPSSKRLTPETKRVVAQVREAGIHVTLVTGKGWTLTSGYARALGLDVPIVALEGALVGHPAHERATPGAMLRSLALMVLAGVRGVAVHGRVGRRVHQGPSPPYTSRHFDGRHPCSSNSVSTLLPSVSSHGSGR